MSDRIKKTFENKSKKLVTFTTGGDPDLETSFDILKIIINNNIDIVEIGMPFSDPNGGWTHNSGIKYKID